MITEIKHFIRMGYLYTQTRAINLCKKKPVVRDDLSTLDKLVKEGNSIARFGDGEIALLNGQDIKFQAATPELARRLKEVLHTNVDGMLVGIPNIFTIKSMRLLTFDSKLFWQHELIDHKEVWYNIPKNREYYDACVTRPYIRYKDKTHSKIIFDGLKELWKDRDIVIVEGIYSRLGVGNDLFDGAKSIRRILGPAKDAFERYDELLSQVLKLDTQSLILISLGPTATVLSYDLHNAGYQAIDLGHIDLEYEWFLREAKTRVAIDNKMVNELETQGTLDEVIDSEYEKQIICRIA